jgi:hypothetical protein
MMCKWLKEEDKSNLTWKLAWRGTRDGFGGDKFHSLCDNKGESIVVIKCSSGYLFGGYASASWNSSPSFANAPNSFLFTLSNPHAIPPTKYPVKDSQNAIQNSNQGPIFGHSDIRVSAYGDTNTTNLTNFPYYYVDTTGKGNETFTGSYRFRVGDIEVFTH